MEIFRYNDVSKVIKLEIELILDPELLTFGPVFLSLSPARMVNNKIGVVTL